MTYLQANTFIIARKWPKLTHFLQLHKTHQSYSLDLKLQEKTCMREINYSAALPLLSISPETRYNLRKQIKTVSEPKRNSGQRRRENSFCAPTHLTSWRHTKLQGVLKITIDLQN